MESCSKETYNSAVNAFIDLANRKLSKSNLCPICKDRPRCLVGDCICLTCTNGGKGLDRKGLHSVSKPAHPDRQLPIVEHRADLVYCQKSDCNACIGDTSLKTTSRTILKIGDRNRPALKLLAQWTQKKENLALCKPTLDKVKEAEDADGNDTFMDPTTLYASMIDALPHCIREVIVDVVARIGRGRRAAKM